MHSAAFSESPLHAFTAPWQMCCEICGVANATGDSHRIHSDIIELKSIRKLGLEDAALAPGLWDMC